MAGKTRNYTEEFKKKIVSLHTNRKSALELAKEYDLVKSTVTKWARDYGKTGSWSWASRWLAS